MQISVHHIYIQDTLINPLNHIKNSPEMIKQIDSKLNNGKFIKYFLNNEFWLMKYDIIKLSLYYFYNLKRYIIKKEINLYHFHKVIWIFFIFVNLSVYELIFHLTEFFIVDFIRLKRVLNIFIDIFVISYNLKELYNLLFLANFQ
jgi:hypothetical protein